MKFKFITCTVCKSSTRMMDPESGAFTCEKCGYSGLVEKSEEILDSYSTDANLMQGLNYTVDIVMVIDATSSMRHLIEEVKNNALRFYDDLQEVMSAKSKVIDQLRVKVIAFRDFYADGKHAMVTSDFFTLPGDQNSFSRFVKSVTATGGGNLPENGLEALSTAINSDWERNGSKRRQIIVIWTDAATHPLEKARDKPKYYPSGMPKDMNELTDSWEAHEILSPSSKRLILFSPDKASWTDIASHWSNTIQYPSTAGKGLNSLDYKTILEAIANSV